MARLMTRQSRYSTVDRGSQVIITLERAWESLRTAESRIPRAVLTLVDARSRKRLRGYFAHSRWKKPGRHGGAHEIAISPDLIGQPKSLLATLLHESAHAILHEAGKNAGMGSTGYYHTKFFRNVCIQLGLDCRFRDTRYGWTITQWPEGCDLPERWLPALAILQGLPSGTGSVKPRRNPGKPTPAPGRRKLVCGCDNDSRALYAPNSVVADGGILCAFCNQPFLEDLP
jgi:hypothetical protein